MGECQSCLESKNENAEIVTRAERKFEKGYLIINI